MPLKDDHIAGDAVAAADLNKIAQFINAILPIGTLQDFFGLESQVQNGMLLCSGKTVGDASSNATARANADMEALFTHLWEIGDTDGTLVINDSAGSPTTYGANAAADFAAHKAIALPDLRGRVSVGRDNMGSSDAGRMVVNDAESEKVGGVAGAETHTLSIGEIPSHTHQVNPSGGNATGGMGTNAGGGQSGAVQSGSAGGGGAHNNVQPSLFLNKIIWTGVTW